MIHEESVVFSVDFAMKSTRIAELIFFVLFVLFILPFMIFLGWLMN